ncbi:DNA topoisomerase [Capnocytophaga sp. oral taxon 332 str. F0381]|uniref:type IA DNA topoisomerase n=1 Tax=Capnocytophaga sp. oral taxon 332 TaxID=712213 RepID=UPI0002A19D51|nr:type IA DNA topoisomerase [Capnocytophaga sp. oral taxon 332]EKY06361.1 DNA topoisomerase [Capnocytophaga sp. oral taxon 332 str. F0381]
MQKTLILAEKPSQLREYVKALGGFTQKGDYYESDRYIASSALGHLIELAEDTAYRPEGKWDKSYLPLVPPLNSYIYEPKRNDSGRQAHLKKLATLFKNPEIGMIYVATDSDREGELIFRYIYNYFGCKLPYKRIWLSALVDGEIRQAFAAPKYTKGDPFLENLSESAYARAITDWLIGANATQAATLQLGGGKLLSIGRVQTAILKIVADRYLKNKSHQKSYTYKLLTHHSYNGVSYTAESPIYKSKAQAEQLLSNLAPAHNFVSFQRKTERKTPPLLHTLDSLTIVANKLYKYTAAEVLASAQRLYEGKLTSYPRTEDAYITEEGYNKLKGFLPNLVNQCLNITDFVFPASLPASVNGAKITGSHDALVPTGQTNGIENLSQQDQRIYALILYRCLESFSEAAVYEKGVYEFENQGTPFKTYTSNLVQEGWKKYSPKVKVATAYEDDEDDSEEDTNFILQLPHKQGDKVTIEKKNLKEIESKPPAIYTPASLTADLCNLSKFLQEQSPEVYAELQSEFDLKGLTVGTDGTRPNIIEQLVTIRKYIAFEKNKYIPTELGLQFYNAIKDLEVVNVAQTARLEYQLKQVADGKVSIAEYYNRLSDYVKSTVAQIFSLQSAITASTHKGLGTCPLCKKGQIVEYPKSYGCTEFKNGCKYTIWKEVAHKKLTPKNVEDLLQKGKTSLIKGFKSKTGSDFEAYLVLDKELKIGFEFNNKKK